MKKLLIRWSVILLLGAWWLSPIPPDPGFIHGIAQVRAQAVPGQTSIVVLGVQGTTLPNFSVAPPPAPVVAANTLAGTLAAGQYSTRNTFITATGETLPSASTLVTLTGAGQLVVTSPTCPAGVTTYNVYMAGTVGAETKQGSAVTCGTNFTQSAALGAGAALPAFSVVPYQLDASGRLFLGIVPAPAQSAPGSPQTPLTASSGTLVATAGTCTLAGVAGKTTYITGFQITGAGATGASVVVPTVTGTISGTLTYELAIPAGAAVGVTPLIVSFPIPVPASAVNTAIVVNIPSFGAGNTNASCVAEGFQQ